MRRVPPNVKRGFNRLFVVLTGLWIVYCCFIYPMQQRRHARQVFQREFYDCFEPNGHLFSECIQYAELKSGENEWSLKAYYARESWFLVLVIVALPFFVYGLFRSLMALVWWVWLGFRPELG